MVFAINVIGISEYLCIITRNFNVEKSMRNIRIATATGVVIIFTNRNNKETFITAVVKIVSQAFLIEGGQLPGMNCFGCSADSLVSADFALLCTHVCFQHDATDFSLINLKHQLFPARRVDKPVLIITVIFFSGSIGLLNLFQAIAYLYISGRRHFGIFQKDLSQNRVAGISNRRRAEQLKAVIAMLEVVVLLVIDSHFSGQN
ncbi:putative membrane protein [Pantoea agglomerans]|nr:putative membrane protein [Pantoea agglomerans]